MFNFSAENLAYIFIGLVTSLILALIFFRKKNAYPYFSRDTLLTPAELKFYSVLKAVVNNKYDVCCKVRLGDIITCSEVNWHKGFGPKISAKHLDFVLMEPKTASIILCIELDDSSHNHPSRIARDKFLNAALAAADVPLLRIPVTRGYDMGALEKEIVLRLQ